MASHNCQVQHAEKVRRRDSPVHCRPWTGPSKPQVCPTFWRARSAWRFCSHRTRGYPAGLKMKKMRRIHINLVFHISAVSNSICLNNGPFVYHNWKIRGCRWQWIGLQICLIEIQATAAMTLVLWSEWIPTGLENREYYLVACCRQVILPLYLYIHPFTNSSEQLLHTMQWFILKLFNRISLS